jgi:hypothetical protein
LAMGPHPVGCDCLVIRAKNFAIEFGEQFTHLVPRLELVLDPQCAGVLTRSDPLKRAAS